MSETGQAKPLTADEMAALCRNAATEAGYPPQLAEFAGEMAVWLERHRLPGAGAMAIAIEGSGGYDRQKAQPRQLESGEFDFPEPITAGLFLLQNFEALKFPARINGPSHGALLMAPFFAMAAQQRKTGVRIAFLDEADKPVARLSYEDGQSALEGDGRAVLVCRKLGIEFPAKPDCDLASPADGPFKCLARVADQLALKH